LFSSKAGIPRQHPIEEPTLPVTNPDATKKEPETKDVPAASPLPQHKTAPLGWFNGIPAQQADAAVQPQ